MPEQPGLLSFRRITIPSEVHRRFFRRDGSWYQYWCSYLGSCAYIDYAFDCWRDLRRRYDSRLAHGALDLGQAHCLRLDFDLSGRRARGRRVIYVRAPLPRTTGARLTSARSLRGYIRSTDSSLFTFQPANSI